MKQNEKKRELSLYSYSDFTGIARHLEDMARQGWQLEKLGGALWHYRRCVPCEMRYAVAYFPKASDLDAGPSQEQREFWELCQSTGWQLAANRAQMQIFCNPDANAIPVETDPVVQVDNIHASMKKGVLLSNLVVMVCALVALFGQLNTADTLRDFLASPFSLGGVLIWGTLGIHCGWEVVHYLRWHQRARAAAREEDILLPLRTQMWRQIVLLAVCAVYVLFLLFSIAGGDGSNTFSLLYGVVYAVVITVAARGSQYLMRKKGVSPTKNRAISALIAVAAGLALLFGMVKLVLSDRSSLQLWGHADAETVTYTSADGSRTYTYDFYRDDLPLTVEDLLGAVPDPEYSRRLDVSGTPFLTKRTVRQRIPYYGNRDKPELEYTVWDVGFDCLYEPIKESFFQTDEYRIHGATFAMPREWRPVDAAPWGAEDAYQYYWDGEPYSTYLLCYEDRFVELSFDGWNGTAPTAEQMALVHDALTGD